MKIYLLLTFIFFQGLSINSSAQQSRRREKLNAVGVQARLIDLMPLELAYLHLSGKKLPSYGLKLGYGKGYKNKVENIEISEYVLSNQGFDFSQSFNAFFVKPGIVIISKKNPVFRQVYLFNYCFAQSKDNLLITSEDQLLGRVKQNYKETNIYQSIELEGNYSFCRSPLFELSFGYTMGYKLQNQIPFTTIVNGIDKGSTYSPGQGAGKLIYVNLFVGFLVKL